MQADRKFSIRSKLPKVQVVDANLYVMDADGSITMSLRRKIEFPKSRIFERFNISMTNEEARELGERLIRFSE